MLGEQQQQPARPGTLFELEKLLAMEDGLPHERVPVDDFFHDYLNSLAHNVAAVAAAGPSDGPCPSDSCTPTTAPPPFGMMVPADVNGMAQLAHLHQGALQHAPTVANGGWQLPLMPGKPAGQSGVMGPAAIVPVHLLGLMAGGMGGAAAVAAKAGALAQNGRHVSNQRQATNREAQKRYRERQKQRLLEMQVTIDRLQRQLDERQSVHSQNLNLEEQHYRLQAQLARMESEAEVLQWQHQQAQRGNRQLRRSAVPPADAVAADSQRRSKGMLQQGGAAEAAAAAAVAGSVKAEPMDADGPEQAQQYRQQQPQQQQSDGSAAGSAVGPDASAAGSQRHDSVGSLPADSDPLGASATAAATAAQQPQQQASGSTGAGGVAAARPAAAGEIEPVYGMYGAPPPHKDFDALLERFQAQVTRMKEYLDAQELRGHNPSSLVLSTSTRGQLLEMVQEALGICRDLLRVEGVDVIELLQQQEEGRMGTNGSVPGSALRQKWLHVLEVLRLTQEQQQQIILQRSAHLALMRRIYQQRQQLNMQAMSLMLMGPHNSGAMGGSGESAQQGAGGPAVHASSGAHAAKLAAVLRLIKENLRREQRAAMEINSCTLSRILTPVQAALYVCEAFPLHCDALAMSNVLYSLANSKACSGAGSAGTSGNSTTPVSSMG